MKVLAVHPHDPTSPLEPWTIRMLSLARELRGLGHEVRTVGFRLPGWQAGPQRGITLLPRGPGSLSTNTATVVRWGRWADVIHLQKCLGHAAVPALAAAYLGRKPIHYDWDDWEEGIQREHRASRAMVAYMALTERLLPRLVDTISVSSHALWSRCVKLGVPTDNVSHVPVGADLELFRPDAASGSLRQELAVTGDVVVYVGQLHGSHDAALLVKAAKSVVEKRAGVTFLVLGEGGTRPRLQHLAGELGLRNSVRFVGSVPHGDVPRYLALAAVAVASLGKGEAAESKSPLKVAEYLAAGKAIVATDVGEATRMIRGCGTLVPPGDGAAMARAILRYLEDPERRLDDGVRARRRAEETYNWTAGARTLQAAYQRALGLSD